MLKKEINSLIDLKIEASSVLIYKRIEDICGETIAHSFGVMLEYFDDKFKIIHENFQGLEEKFENAERKNEARFSRLETDLCTIKIDMNELKTDVKKIKGTLIAKKIMDDHE